MYVNCWVIDSMSGWYSHIQTIEVCAAVKGMLFRQLRLEQNIEIRQFWSRIQYNLLGKWLVQK